MPAPTRRLRRSARRSPPRARLTITLRASSLRRKASSNRVGPSTSGDLGDLLDDLADQLLGARPLGLALEAQQQAMRERRDGSPPDILERGGQTAVSQGPDLGRQDQGLGPAWRAPVADQACHLVAASSCWSCRW